MKRLSILMILLLVGGVSFAQKPITINFRNDRADLSAKAKQTLIELAKNNPNSTIQLTGHSDPNGDAEYNLKLSERRVLRVKNFLVSQGLDAFEINQIAMGESLPIYSGEDNWRNRRVEIRVAASPPPRPKQTVVENRPPSDVEDYKTKVFTDPNNTNLVGEKYGMQAFYSKDAFPNNVKVELQELKSMADLLANDVAAISEEGKILKTAGMFSLCGTSGGQVVPAKEGSMVTFRVPALEYDPKMAFWDEIEDENGNMRWVENSTQKVDYDKQTQSYVITMPVESCSRKNLDFDCPTGIVLHTPPADYTDLTASYVDDKGRTQKLFGSGRLSDTTYAFCRNSNYAGEHPNFEAIALVNNAIEVNVSYKGAALNNWEVSNFGQITHHYRVNDLDFPTLKQDNKKEAPKPSFWQRLFGGGKEKTD